MKKTIALLFILFSVLAPVMAEAFISANDLDPAKLSSAVEYDGVHIYATADKGVTIETIDETREAEDGEVFNARIKLNGSGKPGYRSIGFTAAEGETLTVYLNSSSKSDARSLLVVNADGNTVATLTADPDTGTAGIATAVLPAAGDYLVYSKSGGINVYMLISE